MSLLSSKHIDVVIGADFCEIILRTKGLRAKTIMQKTVHFDANHSQTAFEPALMKALTQLNVKANTPLSFFLLSDYVQYTALPAQAEDMSRENQQAYAQAAFEQLFGEVAQDWTVAVQDAPPFSPVICAAIKTKLVETLKNIASQARLKLMTVAPFLNTVVDHFQKEISSVSGYLAVVEQNRILLLQLQNGRPINIAIEVMEGGEWDFMLMQMLTRARLTAFGERKLLKQVLIHAPLLQLSRHQRLNSEHLHGWRIQWLSNTKLFELNHLSLKEAAA